MPIRTQFMLKAHYHPDPINQSLPLFFTDRIIKKCPSCERENECHKDVMTITCSCGEVFLND